MKILKLFIFWVFLTNINADEVKIQKVLDCNKFLLQNGKIIKLAHVKTPTISVTDNQKKKFAKHIITYAKLNLYNKELITIPDSLSANPNAVHLLEVRKFHTINYNEEFIRNGYGKYDPEGDNLFAKKYISAENYALKHDNGRWGKYQSDKYLKTKLSFDFSLGFGVFQMKEKLHRSIKTLSLISLNTKKHEFSFRYINHLNSFWGTAPYRTGVLLDFDELSLLFGRSFLLKSHKAYASTSLSTGISFNKFTKRGEYISYENYEDVKETNIGLPIQASFRLYRDKFPLHFSIHFVGNLNELTSYSGFMLGLGFNGDFN